MKKILIVIGAIIALFMVGCALTTNAHRAFAVDPQRLGERIYKDEFPILPSDFPNELFVKWFSRSNFGLVPVDFNGDKKIDTIIGMWIDNNKEPLAAIHIDIFPSEKLVATGFVEFNNSRAQIVWIAKCATDKQVGVIDYMVEEYNAGQIKREVRHGMGYRYFSGIGGIGGSGLLRVVHAEGF